MFKCLPILTEKCLIIEKNSLYHTMSAEENNVDSILFIYLFIECEAVGTGEMRSSFKIFFFQWMLVRFLYFNFCLFTILIHFLYFRKIDKFINLGVFLEVKMTIINFLNPLRVRLVHWMKITIEIVIFITMNKMCCNVIIKHIH